MSSRGLLIMMISLVERSRSSFALVVSFVQVRRFIFFPAMPMRDVSGRSKPMRAGHHTRIHRLRQPMDGILF
jgi:hypothetical protein